ncbi:MAG: FeoB-associated Cys-rich membrane protein [Bacillota bacterium]
MDFIVGGIIVLILGLSVTYMVKEKKKGNHCCGCSCAGQCGKTSCTEEE